LELSELISAIRVWVSEFLPVRSAFLLGSAARGQNSPSSDLDIVLETDCKPQEILEIISSFLEVKHSIQPEEDKLILYIGNRLTKLDCWVVEDARDCTKYFWGSIPSAFQDWILVDRNSDLQKRLLETAETEQVYANIQWLNRRFVSSLEAASSYHSQSDTFRYVFSKHIAHSSLIRLACHVAGETDSLYLPKSGHRALEGLIPEWTSEKFGTSGSLRTANREKRNLLDAWLELNLIARELGIDFGDIEADATFLKSALERDYFWNLRDFSDGLGNGIQSGRILRASCLSPHVGEPELENLLEQNGISWIVDLRSHHEMGTHQYPRDFYIDVHEFPTWVPNHRPSEWPPLLLGDTTDYIGFLAGLAPHMPEIIQLINSGKPGLIHCYAGRDRTGVLCAVLQWLLGCEREDILRGYMMSSDADEEAMSIFLNWLDRGIEHLTLIADLSLNDSDIIALRNSLCMKQ
jgi:predicted nucleotidyltransferase